MRSWFARLSIVTAFALQAAQPPPGKPFVECTPEELIRAVPELAGMQIESSQDRLDGLLAAEGGDTAAMLGRMVNLSAVEQIHEMRFADGMAETNRQETYRYVIRAAAKGTPEAFDEERLNLETGDPAPAPGDFLVISHFERLLDYVLPQYRQESSFRYLGRAMDNGQDSWVVAFAQHAGSTQPPSHVAAGNGHGATLQGLVWIDVATRRVTRLRADLSERVGGSPLHTLATDLTFVPVKFVSTGNVLWLPATVTVHARFADGQFHTVHRYSNYRLYGSEEPGVPAAAPAAADDAWELLDRGIALGLENKPAEAIALLRDALRLNPEISIARYHLAPMLRAAGDSPGAEAELREAVRQSPDFGSAHNLLGILLFKRGDIAAAATELRTAAQLQPGDTTVHLNLAQVLEKSDPNAALEQYRIASTLAPEDAAVQARYQQFQRAPKTAASSAPDSLPASRSPETAGGQGAGPATIKVEVRQVLVPVVVTDKDKHHVTGLTQADFHVFEDGVEQKITGFSVENLVAGSPSPVADAGPGSTPGTSPGAAPSESTAAGTPATAHRTYLICIDSLHSAFANLVHMRQALSKLFGREPAGDAQYIVLALGNTTQIVQGPTSDPAAVLKAIESKNFSKLFLASRQGSMEEDLRAYRRILDEARRACDGGLPECAPMRAAASSQAPQLANQEQMYTVGFLQQFRHAVEQFARGTGRRTIILLSDGFQLVPGREAFQLLEAYFGGEQSSFRAQDRMTDLEPILRLAANHNIPVYTIDSRGLYTQGFYDASNPGTLSTLAPAISSIMDGVANEAGDTLAEIAAATGGTAYRNSNDILAGLERAFADGRQYYILAYVPANANPDGKFRAISVRVRDGKLPVNAKRGYWAVGN